MDVASLPSSLSKIEYLTTFNAFIYGYIMARFLYGWGKIISNRENIKFSIEHILWSVFAFFMLISLWWNSWLHIENIGSRSWTFYASIIPPFVMYLISSLYFPEQRSGEQLDLNKDSTFKMRQSAFLYFLIYLLQFITEFNDRDLNQFIPYYSIVMAVCLTVFFTRRIWVARLSLLIGFTVLAFFIYNMPNHYFSERNTFNGFSFSEYLSTFVTFMYGFIVARFLEGWTWFATNRRTIKLNYSYLLWTFLIFGVLIDFWWGLWNRSATTGISIGYFLLSLLVPIGFYFVTSLLFQHSHDQRSQDSFNNNYKLIFCSIIGIFIADFLGARFINGRELLNIENLFLLFPICLSVFALLYRGKTVLILAWILLLTHNIL